MRKRIPTVLATTGLLGGLVMASAVAQEGEHKKMSSDKMASPDTPGKKMSQQDTMDKMSAMSADDKGAMFDKMTEKDKMAAMNMSGKKMSSQEAMDAMGKMSNQDKADVIDKLPADKKMSMMNGGSGMHHGSKKMGKMGMGKMGKMDK
ncbi:MAG: hypothetical protein ABJB97_05975 [Acidobacteriota bacterium]